MNAPDFYDIYDYYEPSFWSSLTGKLCIAGIILTSLALIIFFIIKKKKKPKTPWEWALLELKRLSPAQCKNKQDYKNFYFNLTELTKKYFNKRFNWATEDKTDDEFVLFLHEQKFDKSLAEKLKKITDNAVWIKFANQEALKVQADSDLSTIKEIIEKTIPSLNKSHN
jgi:hypothetical protein